jgi:hypothetical protein
MARTIQSDIILLTVRKMIQQDYILMACDKEHYEVNVFQQNGNAWKPPPYKIVDKQF